MFGSRRTRVLTLLAVLAVSACNAETPSSSPAAPASGAPATAPASSEPAPSDGGTGGATPLPTVRPTPEADVVASVLATVETPALLDDDEGGLANGDDPAIWVHPTNPGQSRVIVTAKNGGLYVYDLAGAEVQHLPAAPAPGPDDEAGRLNNVDLVYGFDLGGRTVDLAIVSDRGMDLIRSFAIDADSGELTEVTADGVPFVFSSDQAGVNEQATVYGVSTWTTPEGTFVFTSQRHETWVAMLRLMAVDGKVGYEPVGKLQLPASFTLPDGTSWAPCDDPGDLAQVEGMVVDGERSILYTAQEGAGIWRIPVTSAGMGEAELFEPVREYGIPWIWDAGEEECIVHYVADPGFGGIHIARDVEGLTIYHGPGDTGLLLASSQGDSRFVVLDRAGDNPYIGTFEIADGDPIDGSQHSDGAMVLNVPLGDAFPQGVFVAHDGENLPAELDGEGEERENTNFKFVPWQDVAAAVAGGLPVDTTSWAPR